MQTDNLIDLPNGVRMPRPIYGTAWKKDKTAEYVATSLRLGFRGIDTACQPKHYFEPGVGVAVEAFLEQNKGVVARSDLYLQTKFTAVAGQDPKQIPYDARAPLADQVAQSFRASLNNLRTDYLDCLVLHSPMENAKATQVAWRAMESLVADGSVRQLGISNCYALDYFQNLYDWARVKPAVLQNRFYADTGYDGELRAYCRERRIVYQSFWTLSANPNLLTHAALTALTSKYQRTSAQVLFRYLTQMEVVPLTGTRSESHMRDDLAIFDFALTESERASITALL